MMSHILLWGVHNNASLSCYNTTEKAQNRETSEPIKILGSIFKPYVCKQSYNLEGILRVLISHTRDRINVSATVARRAPSLAHRRYASSNPEHFD